MKAIPFGADTLAQHVPATLTIALLLSRSMQIDVPTDLKEDTHEGHDAKLSAMINSSQVIIDVDAIDACHIGQSDAVPGANSCRDEQARCSPAQAPPRGMQMAQLRMVVPSPVRPWQPGS